MGDNQAPTGEGAYASRRTAPTPFSGIWHNLVTYWVLARFPFRFYFGALGALLVMVFGRAVYSAPLYNIPVILSAFVIISLINAGGCAINDFFDREADAISKPHMPIPAGDISPNGS